METLLQKADVHAQFFFLYCGVNYLLDLWPCIFRSPYIASVIDNRMSKEHDWNDCDRGTEQY